MTLQEQVKKRKERAKTSKMVLVDKSTNLIRMSPSSYITDDEWNDICYAITQAVDKAFDAGVRYQKTIGILESLY